MPGRLAILHFDAPPFQAEIAVPQTVVEAARAVGLEPRVVRVQGPAEARAALVAVAGDPETLVVVVSAHGGTGPRHDRVEPASHLLLKGTDPRNQAATSFDADAIVEELGRPGLPPRLVLVDACEVRVREARGPRAPLAVVLAHPEGSAESVEGEGILSRAFARSLAGLGDARQGEPSLAELVEEVAGRVRQESSGRQRPALVTVGDASFLRSPARDVLHLRRTRVGTGTAAIRALVDIACDALLRLQPPGPGLSGALLDELRALPEPTDAELELRVALEACACRFTGGGTEGLREAVHRATSRDLGVGGVALGLHALGWRRLRGDDAEAQQGLADLHRAADLAARLGEPGLQAMALDTLATAYRQRGDTHRAIRHYERSRQARPEDDALGREISRQNLGRCLLLGGDFEEAERCFDAGVEACARSLDARAARGIGELSDLLASTCLHVTGAATLRLLRNADRREFESLHERARAGLELAARVNTVSARPLPLAAAEEALALGKRARRPASEEDARRGGLVGFFAATRRCTLEGAPAIDLVEAGLAGASEDWERGFQLVALHHLWEVYGLARARDLRDRLLEDLRNEHGFTALPRADAPPWNRRDVKLGCHLAIDAWPEWGPLAAQREESAPAVALPYPSVSEKYLQLLLWCTGLLVSAASGGDLRAWRTALEGELDGRSRSLKVTFGTAARVVGTVVGAARPSTDWARRVVAAWKDGGPWRAAGYPTLDDLVAERNVYAHYRSPSPRDAQRIIDRHVAVIRALGDLWAQADLPRVERDEGRGATLLVTAAGRFRCDPLLSQGPGDAWLVLNSVEAVGDEWRVGQVRYGSRETGADGGTTGVWTTGAWRRSG